MKFQMINKTFVKNINLNSAKKYQYKEQIRANCKKYTKKIIRTLHN